jgi:hypothetical protein
VSIPDLLARLDRYGVALRGEGDTLRYHPRCALTPALIEELRRQKRAILASLAADEPEVAWRVAAMRRRHPRPWTIAPTLTARDVPRGAGGCLSCGELDEGRVVGVVARCRPCALAAQLVLSACDEGRVAARAGIDPGMESAVGDPSA